jgi:hypothetical protein
MTDDEADILSKHARRRRDVLATAAITAPVVSLLLAQASRPAQAGTYKTDPPPVRPSSGGFGSFWG